MQNMNYNDEGHNDFIYCNTCNDSYYNGYNAEINHNKTEKHLEAIGKYIKISCPYIENKKNEENYCQYCFKYFSKSKSAVHYNNDIHKFNRERYFLNNILFNLEVNNMENKEAGEEIILKTIILKHADINKDIDNNIKIEYVQQIEIFKKFYNIFIRVYLWSEVKKSGVLIFQDRCVIHKFENIDNEIKNKNIYYLIDFHICQFEKIPNGIYTPFSHINEFIITYLQLIKTT